MKYIITALSAFVSIILAEPIITEPNHGAVYFAGNDLTIRWSWADIRAIKLGRQVATVVYEEDSTIAEDINPGSGEYVWKIPTDFNNNVWHPAERIYFIKLNTTVYVEDGGPFSNGYFTIRPSTPT
ncbi:hypothetical protein BJV82DRAFT_675401 [Fennellomyces sp. T-0311]|nr:hypothetical protein BJV82DRAFT_675401 [Fennellomyces sp. T-0311]